MNLKEVGIVTLLKSLFSDIGTCIACYCCYNTLFLKLVCINQVVICAEMFLCLVGPKIKAQIKEGQLVSIINSC